MNKKMKCWGVNPIFKCSTRVMDSMLHGRVFEHLLLPFVSTYNREKMLVKVNKLKVREVLEYSVYRSINYVGVNFE